MNDILIKVGGGLLVAVLFSLAVFVHELGHFLAARWLGLVADTFSIGFGPALWKRKVNGTVYKIGCIPFGGYVALPQLDPSGMDAVQGENAPDGQAPRVLPPAAPWRRIVVACAGPFGNLVLAVLLAWIIYLAPGAITGGGDTQLGTVDPDSAAWAAGLRPGQTIERVNGARVGTWYDFLVECHLSGDPARGVRLSVRDGKALRECLVPLATNLTIGVNVVTGVAPRSVCLVEDVTSNSVAAAAGLQSGDHLKSIDGVAIVGAQQFVDYMKASGTNMVRLAVVSGGQTRLLDLSARPDPESGRALLGVRLGSAFEDAPLWMMHRNPWRQLKADALAVARILRAFFFPQAKGEARRAAASVGGPLFIVVSLWHAVQSGLLNSLGFLRLICVNLAIINLLPFPVLDGGHIMFALWELITRRKPHPKVVNVLVNAFAAVLIGLMLLLVWRDVVRMRRMHIAYGDTPAATNAPSATTAPVAATNFPGTPP